MDHFYWVIGFVCALAVGAILCLIIGRKNREKSEYDERQQIVRKTAITLAYTVLMVYLAVWMVLNALEIPFFRTPASIFIGMMLSATVFVIYACILVLVTCVLIKRHMNKKAEAEAKDE